MVNGPATSDEGRRAGDVEVQRMVGMYCPRCGFPNDNSATVCGACGASLTGVQQITDPVPPTLVAKPVMANGMGHRPPAGISQQPGPRSRGWEVKVGKPPAAVGTVIAVDPVWYEQRTVGWTTVVLRAFLLAEFLAIPGIIIWGLLLRVGSFSLLVAAIGLMLLLQYFMPVNLLSLLGIFRLLNPWRHPPQQVPVRALRIRTPDGREVPVVARGHLRGAIPMAGDTLAVWGRVRLGTISLTRAINLHTGATSVCSPGHSRVITVGSIVLVTALGVILYLLARVLIIGRGVG